jgi:hypothetical protein
MEIAAIPTGSCRWTLHWVWGASRAAVSRNLRPRITVKNTALLHCSRRNGRNRVEQHLYRYGTCTRSGYAARIGVNVNDLLVSQPDTGEQSLKLLKLWCVPGRVACGR